MKRNFTQSFKMQAVEKALSRNSSTSLKDVSVSLGIGFSTLNKWIKLLNMVFSMVFELVGSCNQLKSKENNLLLTIEWE